MARPRIHLIAPAASCRPFFPAIGVASGSELITLVQEIVGTDYLVTGDAPLIEAREDESTGGRCDDADRARDIEQALGDPAVAAIVAIRGGAWLTRIIPKIDFSVLDRRGQPVALFGFSELTTLVNIVGGRGYGLGVYDMGPSFLAYGLRRFVSMSPGSQCLEGKTRDQWVADRILPEFRAYFDDVASMISGRGTRRQITATLKRGSLSNESEALFVGGNLTVLSTLIGTGYEVYVAPDDRWVLIEDFNDKIERIDRFLAHLTLAGWWKRCAGVLLGDFHRGYINQTPAVLQLLNHHVDIGGSLPILHSSQVGHVWPMSPIPLHQPLAIEQAESGSFTISWEKSVLTTVQDSQRPPLRRKV